MHCTMYCSIQCNMQYTLHFTTHSTKHCTMHCTLHCTIHCIISASLITADGAYYCPVGSIWPLSHKRFTCPLQILQRGPALHHNTTLWPPESDHPHCLYNTEVHNIKYRSQPTQFSKIGILNRLCLE